MNSEWIETSDKKPKQGKDVLVFYNDDQRKIIVIAAYWGKFQIETNCDMEDFAEYNEENDEYYAPEGWYETSENNPEMGYIYMPGVEVTHWMPKPEAPRCC